jgi:hypothetical protein
MGSKKPTFAQIAKAPLYQTPYSNFTISFFNIFYYFIYIYLFFSQLPKYHLFSVFFLPLSLSLCSRYSPLIFFIPRRMNSSSLSWASYCSSTSCFHPFVETDGVCFCCLLLIFCCFRPNVQSTANALRAFKSDKTMTHIPMVSYLHPTSPTKYSSILGNKDAILLIIKLSQAKH